MDSYPVPRPAFVSLVPPRVPPLPAFDVPRRPAVRRRRWPWVASIAAHSLLAFGLWKFGEKRKDWVVPDLPTVAERDEHPLTVTDPAERDAPPSVAVTLAPRPPQAEPQPPTPVAVVQPVMPTVAVVVPPVVDVPNPVVPVAFVESKPTMPVPFRPNVEPDRGLTAPGSPAAAVPAAPPRFAGGKVLHGLLPEGRRAVYLLDRSASMGLTRETFEAARAALFATAGGTRAGASFQALAYNADAVPLLGGPRNLWLKADADTPARLKVALATLDPEGRSRHDAALKAALAQDPDYVIWITDADPTELAGLKPLLKGVRKPVAVYLCRAAAGKVEAPVEWK